MKNKALIITLVGVILISLGLAPSANANPLLAITLPLAGALGVIFTIIADSVETKEDLQKKKAAADGPFRDNGAIVKVGNQEAK